MLLSEWLEDVSGSGWRWYAKYLSGNDTLATGAHQAGPYLPRDVFFTLLPGLKNSGELNPRKQFPVRIDSGGATERVVSAIWYNNGIVADGTRNEARITGWGGAASPLLDPESTGSLCIFAFRQEPGRDTEGCRVWLCSSPEEEELFTDRTRPIEPGDWLFVEAAGRNPDIRRPKPALADCAEAALPDEWYRTFPAAEALVEWTIAHLPADHSRIVDDRLVRRRECEFAAFRRIEEHVVLPRVREGFDSVDAFVQYAGSITNRRKARSGRSLELHLRRIFDEQGLPCAHGVVSEGEKRPDFLFPSAEAYRDPRFAPASLRMLGVKTTCKDRWRQILNEADRIPVKHLLTLQEGVSVNQFREMQQAGVSLVVPEQLHIKFPDAVRPALMSLEQFIRETRQLAGV